MKTGYIKHIDHIKVRADFRKEGNAHPGDAYDAGNRIILRKYCFIFRRCDQGSEQRGVGFFCYSPDSDSASEGSDSGIDSSADGFRISGNDAEFHEGRSETPKCLRLKTSLMT